jgi:uncharacterized membrane protein
MYESLIDRLQKLLAVKSIVTLALTIVFCVLCLKGMVGPDQFMTVFTVVIAFYFGTQAERKNAEAAALPEIEEALPLIEEKKKIGFSEGLSKDGK